MSALAYIVEGMRVIEPSEAVAKRNPERFATVYGSKFWPATVDANGNVTRDGDEPLSITSKVIDNEDALAPEFSIDLANGTLTLPEGRRGRTASDGVSQDALNARLAALRNGNADTDSQPASKSSK